MSDPTELTHERPREFVCTKEAPWHKGRPTPVRHPDAVCTYDGGWDQEYESFECPNCGTHFTMGLGQ